MSDREVEDFVARIALLKKDNESVVEHRLIAHAILDTLIHEARELTRDYGLQAMIPEEMISPDLMAPQPVPPALVDEMKETLSEIAERTKDGE